MSSRRAFTLIELLVVIAIIAILAAILFPVFANAKERGRQTRCLANLKQLGFAFQQYSDDNGGSYPACSTVTNTPGFPVRSTPTDWCGSTYQFPAYPSQGQIWRYTKSAGVYLCPTDIGIPPRDPGMRGIYKDYAVSYSMNSWVSLMKIDSMANRRISRIMLLIHESRKTINDGKFSMWSTDIPSDVHWDGTTLVYCDGHARRGSQNELKAEQTEGWWNPTVPR